MSLGNANSSFQLTKTQFDSHNNANADLTYMYGLVNAGWRWGNGSNTDGSVTQTIHYFFFNSDSADPSPSGIWSIEQRISVSLAMQTWENVANIHFEEVQTRAGAEIALLNTTTATIAHFAGYSGVPNAAASTSPTNATVRDLNNNTVNVTFQEADVGQVWTYLAAQDLDNFNQVKSPNGWGPDSSARYIVVHEIGHALGLKHPHDSGSTNAPVFPGVTGDKDPGTKGLNKALYSVMSYNTSAERSDSPMALDIAAVQLTYGANKTYNNGNNTYYVPDPTVPLAKAQGSDWGQPGKQYECIWDTGGIDEIVYNGSAKARIDLNPATLTGTALDGAGGFASYTSNTTKNLGRGYTIAGDVTNSLADQDGVTGVIIENASGGSGDDSIRGNGVANVLHGNAGTDIIYGLSGHDTLYGDAGRDTLYGNKGNDSYWLLDLFGGNYDRAIDNGDGHDTVYLQTFAVGPATYTLYRDIEDGLLLGGREGFILNGNSLNNFLQGTDLTETLNGAAGNDTLSGLRGNDTLNGGLGDDIYILNYVTNGAYATVVEARRGGVDTVEVRRDLSSSITAYTLGLEIENGKVLGSGGMELIGNNLSNALWGGLGHDILRGGLGNDMFYGNDVVLNGGGGVIVITPPVNALDDFYGGVGDDTYCLYETTIYDGTPSAYSLVHEALNEGTDTVRVTAAFNGSFILDKYVLVANVENGIVDSWQAAWLVGNELGNSLTGNSGNDALWGEAGADFLYGLAGHDELRGGSGDDNYYLADVFETGPGQWDWDTVTEEFGFENGVDTVSVQAASTSFALSIRNDYQLPDWVENGAVNSDIGFLLDGNYMDNRLTGNAGADQLVGGVGFDVLTGGGGRDVLRGDSDGVSAYDDTFVYRSVNDSLAGETTRDLIVDFEPGFMTGEGPVIFDRIDLSAIDPNSKLKGDQAFVFIGDDDFSSNRRVKVYGELRMFIESGPDGDHTVLAADVTADGIADFQIEFADVIDFTRDHFIL